MFKIVRSSEAGYYNIVNKGSGKVLDVENGGVASGTNVQLYETNGTVAQQWKIFLKDSTSEKIYIVAHCGKFLDVSGGSSSNGTNIWIYDENRTVSQEFILIPYINTTYKTIEIDFNDINSWINEIERVQRDLTYGGSWYMSPSENMYYNGNIITDMKVLSWKTIKVDVPLSGPGNPTKRENIDLPCKIRYKLHTHNDTVKMWFNFTSCNFYQQCECGYRDEWTWKMPWPDLTETTDVQTTDSVLKKYNHSGASCIL